MQLTPSGSAPPAVERHAMACSDAADACYVFGGLVASTGRGLGKSFEGAQRQFDSSAMQSRSCNMFFLGGGGRQPPGS